MCGLPNMIENNLLNLEMLEEHGGEMKAGLVL